MHIIAGSRKGNLKTPGLVTPDMIVQTNTIDSHTNENSVRICLTRAEDAFAVVIDLTMSPQEALDLTNKLTFERSLLCIQG